MTRGWLGFVMSVGLGGCAHSAPPAKAPEGRVVVKLRVDERGKPLEGRVVSGPRALREPCLRTLLDHEWEPTLEDGRPVTAWQLKKCDFRLDAAKE